MPIATPDVRFAALLKKFGNMIDENDVWVTTKEAGAMLGRTSRWVQKKCAEKSSPLKFVAELDPDHPDPKFRYPVLSLRGIKDFQSALVAAYEAKNRGSGGAA